MPTTVSLRPSPALALERLWRQAARLVRHARDAWHRRRAERAAFEALNSLDARLLRDIGLDRSELSSVAAELNGDHRPDRLRVLRDTLAQWTPR
jgi:uncharacterized protein YjiS (DUF1127 family)